MPHLSPRPCRLWHLSFSSPMAPADWLSPRAGADGAASDAGATLSLAQVGVAKRHKPPGRAIRALCTCAFALLIAQPRVCTTRVLQIPRKAGASCIERYGAGLWRPDLRVDQLPHGAVGHGASAALFGHDRYLPCQQPYAASAESSDRPCNTAQVLRAYVDDMLHSNPQLRRANNDLASHFAKGATTGSESSQSIMSVAELSGAGQTQGLGSLFDTKGKGHLSSDRGNGKGEAAVRASAAPWKSVKSMLSASRLFDQAYEAHPGINWWGIF